MARSRWRVRARVTIDRCIEQFGHMLPDELWEHVSANYPFGARSGHPYKIWLSEVRRVRAAREVKLSPEALAAIEVARDLVELGRIDEARALLNAEAPYRHVRPCPVCGAAINKECRIPDLSSPLFSSSSAALPRTPVPHAARVNESIAP